MTSLCLKEDPYSRPLKKPLWPYGIPVTFIRKGWKYAREGQIIETTDGYYHFEPKNGLGGVYQIHVHFNMHEFKIYVDGILWDCYV
jgi:hypothetical protein